ncbi:MAG: hypothetical protein Q7T71_15230 [Herbiconiux sp.]|nr:hypothetical protein [Herbiconiux sp.]
MSDFGDLFGKPPAPSGPPRVTFVCTGNICRSPLAEKVLTARLASSGAGIVVSSAGLHAVVGSPMDQIPAEIARRSGADPEHRGAQIDRALVDSSSLVLTMTRDQRSELVAEFPSAMKRTFTLVEFTRILSELPGLVASPDAASGRVLFDVTLDASRNRGGSALRDGADVDDPSRRWAEVLEAGGGRCVALVDTLAAALTTAPQDRSQSFTSR